MGVFWNLRKEEKSPQEYVEFLIAHDKKRIK